MYVGTTITAAYPQMSIGMVLILVEEYKVIMPVWQVNDKQIYLYTTYVEKKS
jgi:hypothetical protein